MDKTIISSERINRDSNFELARIVTMIMIVIGHFVVHGIWGGEFCSKSNLEHQWNCIIENLIYSFCVCGVNIFVLISGYHKIKFRLKAFLSLWFLCAFYGLIAAFVNNGADTSLLPKLFNSLFVSNSQWFFRAYLWLLVFSPILNSGLDSMQIGACRRFVFILFLLNCFSGWVLNNANADGYNVLQLMFIYIIGRWLRIEPLVQKIHHGIYLAFFFFISILICISAVLSLLILDGSNFPIYFYNNPLVVCASISIFCFFSQIKIQSKIVNTIASTVVAALFIQDFIASEWIYNSINEAYHHGIKAFSSCCVIWFFLIFLIAFIVENFRQRICQPIITRLEQIIASL